MVAVAGGVAWSKQSLSLSFSFRMASFVNNGTLLKVMICHIGSKGSGSGGDRVRQGVKGTGKRVPGWVNQGLEVGAWDLRGQQRGYFAS